MKLFLFAGSDANDMTNNLDWFVVAETFEKANELWTATVEEYLDRKVQADDLT